MLTGKTESGFEYTLEAQNLDNFELLELLIELEAKRMDLLPKIATLLLGQSQKTALMEHVRNEDGIVPLSAMMVEITQILEGTKQLKNS
ncbi:MAG: hypothetical protein QM296_00560 [Bacillota bacterium]|nr:hypothetical protein [Bacillota bacterium]